MTGTQLAALIRYKTRTNSTTFSDSDMLVLVNLFKDEMAQAIVERNNTMFLLPATDSLVADQREYAIPDDKLNRIQRVEIKFSSSSARFPARYIKDWQGSETESEIVSRFSNEEGGFAYTIRRRALFILSGTITAVSAGIRMWYYTYPADLANLTGLTDLAVDPSTTTHGFPKGFHELLARRVAIEYKGRQPKPVPLSAMERNYANDLETAIAAISTEDNSAEIIGELPSEASFGDSGFNY